MDIAHWAAGHRRSILFLVAILALAGIAWTGFRLGSRIETRDGGVIDALNLQQNRE